jgi:hypothetical protein
MFSVWSGLRGTDRATPLASARPLRRADPHECLANWRGRAADRAGFVRDQSREDFLQAVKCSQFGGAGDFVENELNLTG